MQAVGSVVGIAPPNEKDYVKRVIAVGGQTVMCCDAQGAVTVDGRSLVEPYIYEPIEFIPGELDCSTTQMSRRCFGPVTVPDGELWVMGDHRSDSADSSYQCQGMPADSGAICQGPIPVDNVVGKAIAIVMPPSRWGTIGNPDIDPNEPGQLTWSSGDRICGWKRNCCAAARPRLAAMDEVGRGALAGPVTVGVVVVTASIGRVPPGLADSKLLTPAAREALVRPIRRWVTEYAVGHASPAEIDTIGIMAALRLAGRRALGSLSGPVDAVLLDGNHNYLSEPAVLAAACDDPPLFDVLPVAIGRSSRRCTSGSRPISPAPRSPRERCWRRTERNHLLVQMHPTHPVNGFAVNKGYGTPEHVAALREYGPSRGCTAAVGGCRRGRNWTCSASRLTSWSGREDDEGVERRGSSSSTRPDGASALPGVPGHRRQAPMWWKPNAGSICAMRLTCRSGYRWRHGYFELRMFDAWVWDMYRPARFVKNVRVVTFKDVKSRARQAGTGCGTEPVRLSGAETHDTRPDDPRPLPTTSTPSGRTFLPLPSGSPFRRARGWIAGTCVVADAIRSTLVAGVSNRGR